MNKRFTLVATVIAAAMVAISPGWASAVSPGGQENATPTEVKAEASVEVNTELKADAKAEAKDEAMAEAEPAAEDLAEHKVVKGDTLWDISGTYLTNPFMWPEVWQVNPQIKNPHLIYPGETVRLPGMKKPAEAAAAGEAAPAEAGAEAAGEATATATAAKVTKKKSPFEEEPFVDISQTLIRVPDKKEKKVISLDESKKAKIPVATEGEILQAGFISDYLGEETEMVGSPKEERLMFSQEDEVYLSPDDDVSAGEMFVSLRPEADVDHPATGRDLGSLMKVTGLMQVAEIKDGYPLCKIKTSYMDINPNDKVIRYTAPELVYEPVEKNPDLKGEWGYVVAAMDNKQKSATLYTVYLDLGTDDGIKAGDTFVIKRSGGSIPSVADVKSITSDDGQVYLIPYLGSKLGISTRDLPDEEVGEVQVISVQDRTSTAKVVSFSEPILPGYRVYYKD